LTLVALPARAQAPLVVGAVRDQRGAAIAGAVVLGENGGGAPRSTTTDDAGTFALAAGDVTSVLVTCRFCRPATASVRPGEPVVVIVLRYEAVASDAVSPADLESLPYAHVESAIALRPFTLLSQTSAAYPGPALSDRGLSSTGSLLIDAGAPNYDIVSASSPYELVPAQYERAVTLESASDAYLYGDQAGGGTVNTDPAGSGSNWEVATLGSDAIARFALGSDTLGGVFGSFSNDEESRQRIDLSANLVPAAGQSLAIAAGSEQGRAFGSPESQDDGNFTFADATYGDPSLANLYVSAVLDRGGYLLGGEYPEVSLWSDSGLSLGVHSSGPVSAFADFGMRASTGAYEQSSQPWSPLPGIGASLTQTRADAGIRATGNDYDVTAGVGTFWIGYSGGAYGVASPVHAALAVPSLQAQLFPNQRWSVNLEGSGSFTLPTFVDQYAFGYAQPSSIEYQRNSLLAGTLSYTDLSRLRFSFEEASEHVAGASSGTIVSTGLSAAWQIAPELSLRAWAMHVDDTVPPYGEALPAFGSTPTVSAMWLTYEGQGPIRIDAIYRRDLLDGLPFYHVDGDVSGPVAGRLRWYAGIEDRLRRTFADVGLRFGGE
jgi:hypothetical protein